MGNDDVQILAGAIDKTSSLEEAISVTSDDALLMSMGKKPELKRIYNFWTRTSKSSPCDNCFSSPVCLSLCYDSMCLSDYDLVQLVMSGRTVLDHFRRWWPVLSGLGHVGLPSLQAPQHEVLTI